MRFTKFRLSKLRCIEDPYIRNMFLKNAVMFLFPRLGGAPSKRDAASTRQMVDNGL